MTDPIQDLPQPAANPLLWGHDQAENRLARSWYSGRMPHAWLLTGPRGVGKATLAYRLARRILAAPSSDRSTDLFGTDQIDGRSTSLAMAEDHPVFRRVAAGGHPDLFVVQREIDPKTGRLRGEIVIETARRLAGFMSLTPAEAGWRVAIVDSADDMNRNAINAILKLVEEPPDKALILLISHVPGWLPATVRSRCRTLALSPLDPPHMDQILADRFPDLPPADRALLAGLADGSPGRAMTLAAGDGLDLYRDLVGLLDTLPELDLAGAHRLGDRLGKRGAEANFTMFFELLSGWLARFIGAGARDGAAAALLPQEAQTAERLRAAAGLDRWLELWEKVGELGARADRINLDRKQVVLAAFTAIQGSLRP